MKLLSEHLNRALAMPAVQQLIRKDAAVEKDVPLAAFGRYIVDHIARCRQALSPALLEEISP